MSPTGCIVPPHFRPLCSVHCCRLDIVRGDEWENNYLKIRDKISEIEYEKGLE